MSKNLTRKGFALAAVVALGSTLFAGAPATANTSGPLTLVPNGVGGAGATYTSILGAGITLSSVLDADKQAIATTRTGTVTSGEENGQTVVVNVPAVDPLARAYYLVENPAGASVTITLSGTRVDNNIYLYNTSGVAQAGTAIVSNTVTTTAKKFAVGSGLTGTAGARSIANIKVDSPASTSTVKVKVTSFADTTTGNDETTLVINNGEWKSATQEVTLLPAASVPVTTRMSASTDRTGDELVASIVLGSSVNPYAVASSLGVVFYKDGTNITLDTQETSDVVSGAVKYFATSAGDVDTDTGAIVAVAGADGASFVTGGNLNAGVYTARTIFEVSSPQIYLGARSVALDLRDGTNTTVTGAKAVFTKSNNVAVTDGNDALVRATTKSLPVVGQILGAAGADYKAAGVRVRATVTGGATVDATTEITVTGSTDKIVDTGDSIVVFGFTDANGQFPITINSTTGKNLDTVTVDFEALLSTGLYSNGAGNVENITWQTAALQNELDASPSEYLTGATVNVTFTAVDQFGVGIDQTANGRVSIRVDAYIDGAVKTATYSETKATTNGAASFSFANFATAGSNQEIKVQIFEASTAVVASLAYYTVYNNVATSSIAIADSFENRVQYVDYVTGKTTDAAVLKAATDAGVYAAFTAGANATQFANINGTALDANNAGQPGIAVTIAAAGVLFHDAETSTIAKDSITVFSNGQGFFDVQALSQKVNTAGATVTITAGGVSKTTLLKTYLPNTIAPANLKFSWVLPATIVKDTTYSVTATLTDVWGNPVRTLDTTGALDVTAEGSLLVNGEDAITRNFSAAGTSTFFIRSVATIGGPGSLTAALESAVDYATGKSGVNGTVTGTENPITTDVTTTSWNETLWSGTLTTTVDVLDRAPVAAGTVNVGSFNGKLVVYAKDLAGARISWKVGGNWGSAVAVGNTLNRFDRPTPRAGVTVSVEIYVNGVKQLTKSVVTR